MLVTKRTFTLYLEVLKNCFIEINTLKNSIAKNFKELVMAGSPFGTSIKIILYLIDLGLIHFPGQISKLILIDTNQKVLFKFGKEHFAKSMNQTPPSE